MKTILKKASTLFFKIFKFIVDHIIALVALTIVLLLAIPIGFYGMYLYIEPELPSMSQIQEPTYKMPLQIYTKDKYLIAEFGNEISLPVKYESIPQTFIHAFLAAEDDTFFEHEGISIKGLGRAVTEIISDSGKQTGGSTITMQVAKNYFLSPERTFKRKLTELFLARRIEQNLTKEEILTLYVNKIYLGSNAYGINGAARKYYSKTLDHLTIAQMAMIAGLPKAPSQNNPLTNPERALERRNWILGRMLNLGYISQMEHDKAITEELDLMLYKSKIDKSLPYLAEWARYELEKKYGKSVMNSGWRVQLTVDSKRQMLAENALKKGLVAYGKRHGWHGVDKKLHGKNIKYFKEFDGNWPAKITEVKRHTMSAILNDGREINIRWSGARKYINPNRVGYFSSDAKKVFKVDDIIHVRAIDNQQKSWRVALLPKVQGALAAVNPKNGAVEAMAGGFDFHYSKFNRATQGWRQPGSIIKPLIYTLALEKGYRPNSMVSDEKLRVGSWKPKNSDGRYYGKIPLRKALYLSRNLVSIRLLQSVGIAEARQFISLFGLSKNKMPSNLTLALGTGQVLPLQMATAYATFANGGHRVQPHFIRSIYQFNGDLIYLANPAQSCAECFNESILGNAKNAKTVDSDKTTKKTNSEKPVKPKKPKIPEAEEAKSAGLTETHPNTDMYSNNATAETNRLTKFTDVKLAAEQAPRIISPKVAYDMASILRDVVVRGTGKRAQRTGRVDIGGKTGTTNMARDAWFAGFQPSLAAVVWVGYDIPRPLGRREYGGVAALPIWARFMRQALSDTPTQWVTSKNISNSDKQSNKVIKVSNDQENEEEDQNDLTYKSSFRLPPTAYFIQRKTRVTKPVKPKPKSVNKTTLANTKKQADNSVAKDVYQPEIEYQFETYNDIKGNNQTKTNTEVTQNPDIINKGTDTAQIEPSLNKGAKNKPERKSSKNKDKPENSVSNEPIKKAADKPKEAEPKAVEQSAQEFEPYIPEEKAPKVQPKTKDDTPKEEPKVIIEELPEF